MFTVQYPNIVDVEFTCSVSFSDFPAARAHLERAAGFLLDCRQEFDYKRLRILDTRENNVVGQMGPFATFMDLR